MLPPVLRPAKYNTPVAAFTIDGLGACWFNRHTTPREWEIAFLRDEGHIFTIGVTEMDQQGRIVQTFPDTSVDLSKHLRFTVANSSDAHLSRNEFPDGFFKAAPDFSRTGDDSYDFRWVIDFLGKEVPHGPLVKLLKKLERPGGLDVTIVSIPNALFYTKSVTEGSVILAEQPKPSQDGFVLGRTNQTVGAGIYATTPGDIGLVNENGDRVLPFPLPYVKGHSYEISLLNMDKVNKLDAKWRTEEDDYVLGDLHRYYDIMEVRGPKYQLFAPRVPRAIDGDCHVVGMGHNSESIPNFDLMTLIQS
ncbi:MAG TPA: hypothetical protein VM911_09545 [Pyrinomonadaceae bacterium]|jgi:hypothetical protein|nr:hypothetical protein [Pyrinomonadaceae bacterium]